MTVQQKISYKPYTPKDYSHLKGLTGISDETLEIHLGLYKGYVTNTNTYNERVIDLTEQGKVGSPDYWELKRRYGFEYNGMKLHEYYFGNLQNGSSELKESTKLGKLIVETYGSLETWKTDFSKLGAARGVGWVILYQDPEQNVLSNHWISLHEEGNVAGFNPLLVMDVWEHAWFRDYKPADRPKYVEAFLAHVDWDAVEKRIK